MIITEVAVGDSVSVQEAPVPEELPLCRTCSSAGSDQRKRPLSLPHLTQLWLKELKIFRLCSSISIRDCWAATDPNRSQSSSPVRNLDIKLGMKRQTTGAASFGKRLDVLEYSIQHKWAWKLAGINLVVFKGLSEWSHFLPPVVSQRF